MSSSTRRILLFCAIIAFGTALLSPSAGAQILAIDGSATNVSNCGQGGQFCNGSSPFDLSNVQNGSTPLVIPPNTSGEFLILDDDPGTLASLTLEFEGSLASNASMSCQVSGWPSTQGTESFQQPFSQSTCTVNGVTGKGPDGVTPDTIIWSEGAGGTAGLTDGELFDLRFASFAHAGADHGSVVGVPEPGSLGLLAVGLVSFLGVIRRRVVRLS
jgi:hypothetical protein